ncbi:UNVERIFIED_CONTAM: hypothetical protein GTU68_004182 [Idotea baltica]|nr:hypothetical protein [Idotea baltica]
MTFDAIIDSLIRERRIELRNFGVFEVKARAARKARNPRTGDEVIVPEKHVVTFRPGKTMEARVRELSDNELASQAAAKSQSDSNAPTKPETSGEPDSHSGRWDTD